MFVVTIKWDNACKQALETTECHLCIRGSHGHTHIVLEPSQPLAFLSALPVCVPCCSQPEFIVAPLSTSGLCSGRALLLECSSFLFPLAKSHPPFVAQPRFYILQGSCSILPQKVKSLSSGRPWLFIFSIITTLWLTLWLFTSSLCSRL